MGVGGEFGGLMGTFGFDGTMALFLSEVCSFFYYVLLCCVDEGAWWELSWVYSTTGVFRGRWGK